LPSEDDSVKIKVIKIVFPEIYNGMGWKEQVTFDSSTISRILAMEFGETWRPYRTEEIKQILDSFSQRFLENLATSPFFSLRNLGDAIELKIREQTGAALDFKEKTSLSIEKDIRDLEEALSKKKKELKSLETSVNTLLQSRIKPFQDCFVCIQRVFEGEGEPYDSETPKQRSQKSIFEDGDETFATDLIKQIKNEKIEGFSDTALSKFV
jgi:hypothetical protein